MEKKNNHGGLIFKTLPSDSRVHIGRRVLVKKCRSSPKPHEILCLLRIEAGVVETYLLTILGQGWEMVAFGLILYLKYELGPLQGKENKSSVQLVYYLLNGKWLS